MPASASALCQPVDNFPGVNKPSTTRNLLQHRFPSQQTNHVYREEVKSEHLIAWDERYSTGEQSRRKEQIRHEVERALDAQARARSRKTSLQTISSLYDRESIISRARVRQESVYSRRVSTSNSIATVTSCSVSHNDVVPVCNVSTDVASSQFWHSSRKPSQPDRIPRNESRENKKCRWRKKLEHAAVVVVLGYDPEGPRKPYL
ncbi:hypothetical protein H0H92_000186 [Tricholoma furcatifolium]|nr:hypothetical protein H0H92_000186 [Tricholoma furcatifolium]